MKAQRIWAVIGLVLIVVSILCMLVGLFTGAAKALMMQIALFGFVGAVGILLALNAIRNKAKKDEDRDQE